MTKVHDVLHEAAVFVPPPPDGLDRAVRRGRYLRRRAAMVKAAALPVVVLLTLLAVDSSSTRHAQRIDTVDNPHAPVTEVPDAPAAAPAAAARPGSHPSSGGVALPQLTVASPATGTPTTFLPAPPGPRLAFAHQNTLQTMRVDGSDRRVLLSPGPTPYAWAPDHRTLIVSDMQAWIDVLDVETGARRRLADAGNGGILAADVSPDGREVVYWRRPGGSLTTQDNGPYNQLWVVGMDGTGARTLPVEGQYPSWSPDGTHILFDGCTAGSYVCTVRPDGSDVTPLSGITFTQPRWSPDGTWIAGLDMNTHLGIARPDGTGARRIADRVGSWGMAWTLDSSAVVYQHQADQPNSMDGSCNGCDRRSGLFRVALDGSGDVQLTDDPSDTYPTIPQV